MPVKKEPYSRKNARFQRFFRPELLCLHTRTPSKVEKDLPPLVKTLLVHRSNAQVSCGFTQPPVEAIRAARRDDARTANWVAARR